MISGIANLLALSNDMPSYRELVHELEEKQRDVTRAIVLDAARSYVIASLYKSLERPVLIVTAHSEESKKIHETITTWTRELCEPMLFPEPDNLPYQYMVSDTTTEMERLRVLSTLSSGEDNDYPQLVVTSIPALMQKVTPYQDFTSSCHRIAVGDSISPLDLIRRWQKIGYRMDDMVELPGSISRRGGIIDIYPPSSEMPARVEFTGDIIDSIRLFDPASQRSLNQVEDIDITPATELITPLLNSREQIEELTGSINLNSYPETGPTRLGKGFAELLKGEITEDSTFYAPLFNRDSFLSYLPQNVLLILLEPRRLALSARDFDTRAGEIRREKSARDELPPGFPIPYFKWREVEAGVCRKQCLHFTAWEESDSHESLSLEFKPAPGFSGRMPAFTEEATRLKQKGHRLILVSHQAERLSEILDEAGIFAPPLDKIQDIPPPGTVTLVQGLLPQGWTMIERNHIFTDYELFGFTKERRLTKQRPVSHRNQINDLNPGDHVVHVEHGIAVFRGVTKMGSQGTEKEYVVLEYAAGDRLYVPTDQIHRVSRYIGSGENPPSPSRLGTPEWSRTKQRARKAAEEVAEELVSLYADRGVVDGFPFSADNVWQQELESSFPYLETPDQNRVQKQVKEDMARPMPMDRLICGDVGYGKTEIAIRAAFKAVMDGKQVAVLVPTTVLAQQHHSTFNRRLSAFPLRIEVLSRFKNPKQQRAVLEELARGSVDICIGTHRLLQKDVSFKDLGLLIIDEEQRFGVKHKEFLKQMRKEVDVLTLSATPIPRTLHMSLVGVRDMSTIETPPEDRLPIKTFVAEYNESLIREAILREMERNGQVFFVHNRVQSIAMIAQRIQELVPEVSTAIAHGQMSEDELEMVMAGFARGEIDILVCTTIIESGLDMPNVNTLIVNRADKFGLTQLYQLRGRVGRGANLAYAYFLYDRGKQLTHNAERRLETIFEAAELGAGFNIAVKDLEIRGAGNILGLKQSGQISAVGFNLYCRLLSEAVERAKGRHLGSASRQSIAPTTTVDLPLSTYIPEWYVADPNIRLSLYQRLADAKTIGDIEDISAELQDRFGTLPEEVHDLVYASRIKTMAVQAGVQSINSEREEIILRLFPGVIPNREEITPLKNWGVKIGKTVLKLSCEGTGKRWRTLLETLLEKLGRRST